MKTPEDKIIEEFEANFLDGDKITDCGKSMIRVDDDLIDFIKQSLKTYKETVRREERERVLRIATKVISNPVEFMELTVETDSLSPKEK